MTVFGRSSLGHRGNDRLIHGSVRPALAHRRSAEIALARPTSANKLDGSRAAVDPPHLERQASSGAAAEPFVCRSWH